MVLMIMLSPRQQVILLYTIKHTWLTIRSVTNVPINVKPYLSSMGLLSGA